MEINNFTQYTNMSFNAALWSLLEKMKNAFEPFFDSIKSLIMSECSYLLLSKYKCWLKCTRKCDWSLCFYWWQSEEKLVRIYRRVEWMVAMHCECHVNKQNSARTRSLWQRILSSTIITSAIVWWLSNVHTHTQTLYWWFRCSVCVYLLACAHAVTYDARAR